ncbi:MAG: glycosyltransferase family 4 protein [Armatimonadetes bacterium]|nr:glycosyltransferase family 4 protein [Armatimonadota bacterium]
MASTTRVALLFISGHDERGGIEVVTLDLIRALDRRRFEVWVLSLVEGPFPDELRHAADRFVSSPTRMRDRRGWARAAEVGVRMLQEASGALVHVNEGRSHLLGRRISDATGAPLVRWLHGWHSPLFSRDRLCSWMSIRAGAHVWVANSATTARYFARWLPPTTPVRIIAPGVDLDARRSGEAPPSIRARLGIGEADLAIVMHGRLVSAKGCHVLIEALAILARQGIPATALMVGGSQLPKPVHQAYRDQLETLARRLSVHSRVRFLGFQASTYDFVAAADVVAHVATIPEGFGLVVIEGMGFGKPVIATRTGGPEEILDHGVTGLLTSPGDPVELARWLALLHRRPDVRRRLGAAAQQLFEARHTALRMAEDFGRLYAAMRVSLQGIGAVENTAPGTLAARS